MTDFSKLDLPAAMLRNLAELGFAQMTPVQDQSIPHILQNRDVVVQAKTGSGKTAAFGIGVVHKLNPSSSEVQSLILCPTRELADQVTKELRRIARCIANIKILTLCGGTSLGPQLASLKHGAHIVVGTPGRILKHLEIGSLTLDSLDTLVIDEAHRMLDMGFIDDIKTTISYAPHKRQTLLYSATYPPKIMRLSSDIQENPIHIKTITEDTQTDINEHFYKCPAEEKLAATIKLIGHYKPENVMLFVNLKVEVEEIAAKLRNKGIDALGIHGDLEQYERTDQLVQFSNKSCSVLVATDMAARGLDIAKLSMVINYDLPHDQAVYTHRIGRTGRAGSEGISATLYLPKQTRVDEYRNDTRLFEKLEDLDSPKKPELRAPNITLVIEGGKKKKVRPGDILGALTGGNGIDGAAIGKIDIYENQSYVALDKRLAKQANTKLKQLKIKGRNFNTWVLYQR